MTMYERLIIRFNGCEEAVRDVISELRDEGLMTPEIKKVLDRRAEVEKHRNDPTAHR